jgi:hypothetical protein
MTQSKEHAALDDDQDFRSDSLESVARLNATLQEVCGCEFEVDDGEEDESVELRRLAAPTSAAEQNIARCPPHELASFLQSLQLSENYDIYKHLMLMPRCVQVMKKERGDAAGNRGNRRPLMHTVAITIHHLDDKALAAHAVLREWGATDMTAIWVGYNPLMNEIYRPQLNDIPDDQFRTCVFTKTVGESSERFAERTYSMVKDFTKFPVGEMLDHADFDRKFETGKPDRSGSGMTYMEAMRCLTVYLFLRTVARVIRKKRIEPKTRLLIFEDGGYLHPEICRACLEGWTVEQFRQKHNAPIDEAADSTLGGGTLLLRDVLEDVFIGSSEWTRNGYNRSVRVQEGPGKGKLSHPLFSNAVSQVKTDVEGDTIAVACQLAITMALYSIGVSMKRRRVLLIGARGNIGRPCARHFADILDDPAEQLLCCDLKVDTPDPGDDNVPPWADKPSKSIAVCRPGKNKEVCDNIEITEAKAYKDFEKSRRMKIDLIFGLTGGKEQTRKPGEGPETGMDVFEPEHLQEWLIDGEPDALYLASGSTKTAEYRAILDWLDVTLRNLEDTGEVYVRSGKEKRRLLSLTASNFQDRRVAAFLKKPAVAFNKSLPDGVQLDVPAFVKRFGNAFGTVFDFTIEGKKGKVELKRKKVYLLFNTKPVNFMFHGTPAELLDWSYAQLVNVTAMLVSAYRSKPQTLGHPQIFATDYKLVATTGIFAAAKPQLTKDYPIPDVLGLPIAIKAGQRKRG